MCFPWRYSYMQRKERPDIREERLQNCAKGEVSLYGFNRSENKRTFKTEEDKQLYEERIEKKISAEERLPGDMYNMQTTMENKDNKPHRAFGGGRDTERGKQPEREIPGRDADAVNQQFRNQYLYGRHTG